MIPAAVFLAAYSFTGYFFRLCKVPYPFKWSGVAAGFGAAFLVLAVKNFHGGSHD